MLIIVCPQPHTMAYIGKNLMVVVLKSPAIMAPVNNKNKNKVEQIIVILWQYQKWMTLIL